MADYYTNFSCAYQASAEELDELEKRLKAAADSEDVEDDVRLYGIVWERQKDADGDEFLWIHSDEGPNLEALADVVSEMQNDLKLTLSWGFEYSHSCSKPRLDAYGGGSCFIHRGEQQWFNTGRWLDEKREQAQ